MAEIFSREANAGAAAQAAFGGPPKTAGEDATLPVRRPRPGRRKRGLKHRATRSGDPQLRG